MKYKKLMGAVALGAVATVGLAACGGGSKDGKKGKGEATEDIAKFPIKTSNDAKAVKGGTLEGAVVMDTQFQGLFDPAFNSDNFDTYFMQPSHETLFGFDEAFKMDDTGVATYELDQKAKKATIKITKDVKWSDGKPLVAEDIIQPYLIIGHPDYEGTGGVRYGANMKRIVGMVDYHDGKADSISGIKKIDDKTVEINYEAVEPGLLTADGDGGPWQNAMPAHVFKDMPVKGMESSDAIRKSPVTFGPYKMTNVKRGEFVEYAPNEYYYGEKPKVEKIILRQTPTNSIVEAMKAKKYDFVFSMPTDSYPTYKDTEGYEILGREAFAYTYIGFKLGKWEDGKVAYNKDSKMANKSLRQAMAYALDNQAVGDKYYYGLRSSANTLIPPVLGEMHDKDLKGYTQDIDKANKLLDDAGYKKKDGEEFRRDPKGEKLEIKFASMAGGETAQPLAEYYMNQWKEIGLDVKLTTGRLIDFNAFYDKLKNDDPEVDVYQGAWSVSQNPSQTSLYGEDAAFNYTRFASEENSKLLAEMDSEKSFDADYRAKVFKDWQKYASEEAFAIPTLYRNEVMPVNERVKGLEWTVQKEHTTWADVELTADQRK